MKTFAVAVALAGMVTCSGTDTHRERPPSTVAFEGTDALLFVDIADETGEQRRGLMGVENLPADQGMAFVFDEAVASTFWMKDTPIPLSIAFVDESDRVIGMRDMVPCQIDPCPSYGVDEPFVLAIEANLGWFDEHGIETGDRTVLRVSEYG